MSIVHLSFANYNWQKTDSDIALLKDDAILWKFNFGAKYPKPYFYPLRTLEGAEILAEAPSDHIWHNGLFFQWKYIDLVDDKNQISRSNFWEIGEKHKGRTKTSLKSAKLNEDFSTTIILDINYYTESKPDDIMLAEIRTISVSPPDKNGIYRIDWQMDFTSKKNLTLERHPTQNEKGGRRWGGYAGLAVRANPLMRNFEFIDINGNTSKAYPEAPEFEAEFGKMYQKPAGAVALNGTVEDKKCAVALFSHKDNPKDADTVYYIPKVLNGDLNYLFLSYAYLLNSPKSMKANESLRLNYRIIVSPAPFTKNSLNAEFEKYQSE